MVWQKIKNEYKEIYISQLGTNRTLWKSVTAISKRQKALTLYLKYELFLNCVEILDHITVQSEGFGAEKTPFSLGACLHHYMHPGD